MAFKSTLINPDTDREHGYVSIDSSYLGGFFLSILREERNRYYPQEQIIVNISHEKQIINAESLVTKAVDFYRNYKNCNETIGAMIPSWNYDESRMEMSKFAELIYNEWGEGDNYNFNTHFKEIYMWNSIAEKLIKQMEKFREDTLRDCLLIENEWVRI